MKSSSGLGWLEGREELEMLLEGFLQQGNGAGASSACPRASRKAAASESTKAKRFWGCALLMCAHFPTS